MITGLLVGMSFAACAQDSVVQLPNRLVISSVKNPAHHVVIDSSGIVSVVFVTRTDSLIRSQQRQLSGVLTGFTDSTLMIHVDQESQLTYFRNGTMEQFYYWKAEDTVGMHIDTVRFTDIYSIRFDRGKHKQLIGMLQSTTYTFATGNIVTLVGSFFTPGKYTPVVYGRNLLLTTGISLVAGSVSFLFYPKIYQVGNHPRKHKRLRWRVEVI